MAATDDTFLSAERALRWGRAWRRSALSLRVGAIIFPVGLIMIVLLGLELVTGSFALVPLPFLRGDASAGATHTGGTGQAVGAA